MNKFLIKTVIVGILILAIFSLVKMNNNLRASNDRLKTNQEVLYNYQDSLNTFKLNDSLMVTKVKSLELSKNELSQLNLENQDIIDDLGIKLKRIKKLNQTLVESQYNINTEITDTIVLVDSVEVNMKKINYKSTWIDVEGLIGDSCILEIKTRESLVYIESIIPRKFLFIKFGQKRVSQQIVSKNPNTTVISTEFITVSE